MRELSPALAQQRVAWPRRWCEPASVAVIVLLATGLRVWRLGEQGHGNLYYAAAVRSMSENWHNFLYASFDPAGFLTLDKPPVAFWLQALAVKLLGYQSLALHLPQALAGVLSVVLVYVLTRRACGQVAAAVAGVVIALTPATVAVDRSNLPDSLLLLTLLLAAAALLHGLEKGRSTGPFLVAALVGLAFNIKMIAAFVALPVIYLVYAVASPRRWPRRLAHLAAATAVLAVVSLSWPLFVDLTPTAARPYVGDTSDNSVMSLAFGTFGFGRVAGLTQPPPEDQRGPVRDAADEPLTAQGGRPGPFRLGNRDMAGHISWLIPYAAFGLVALLGRLGRAGPRDPLRAPTLFWGGWFASFAAAFSLSHSPVHPYYTALLAPPIAFFVGAGTAAMWPACQHGGRGTLFACAAVGATALWQCRVLDMAPRWGSGLAPVVLGGLGVVALALLLARIVRRTHAAPALAAVGLSVGTATLLLCPTAWALTPVLAPGGRMVPIADPVLLQVRSGAGVRAHNEQAIRNLVTYLRTRCRSHRYLLAASDIHLLAPIVIQAGEPVMAYGGFSGSDPILSADRFAQLVRDGEVRFVLLTEGPGLGRMGPATADPIATWVRAHGHEVPREQWAGAVQSPPQRHPPAPWGETDEMIAHIFSSPTIKLYDCRTEHVGG